VFKAIRALMLLLFGVAVVIAAVTIAARAFGWQVGPLFYMVAATPYAGLAMAITVIAGLALRAKALALIAAILAIVVGFWWLPVFLPSPATSTQGLHVMTINLLYGRASAKAVVAAVLANDVDVLSVQELTAASEQRLRRAGLDDALAYNYVRATADKNSAAGTGIWSRYPLTDEDRSNAGVFTNLAATVAVPGGPVTMFAVHPIPASPTDGLRSQESLKATREFLASRTGPAVAAGDFNATVDNAPMRQLESDGWTDSATAARAGFVRTWPVLGYPIGPLVAIDHVLTRNLPAATAVEIVEISRSDHKAVVATVPLS
jgi:endonuclease/exonuclease/phosphatase (EEP) superfamily protein YafD